MKKLFLCIGAIFVVLVGVLIWSRGRVYDLRPQGFRYDPSPYVGQKVRMVGYLDQTALDPNIDKVYDPGRAYNFGFFILNAPKPYRATTFTFDLYSSPPKDIVEIAARRSLVNFPRYTFPKVIGVEITRSKVLKENQVSGSIPYEIMLDGIWETGQAIAVLPVYIVESPGPDLKGYQGKCELIGTVYQPDKSTASHYIVVNPDKDPIKKLE